LHYSFFAAAEAIFFPIPPDVLLIALGLGNNRKSFLFVLICATGSIAGAVIGYLVGFFAHQATIDFLTTYILSKKDFDYVANLYNQNAFLAILTAAFTPIPYKVFTLTAGYCKINIIAFVMASIVGRTGRFLAVGTLLFFFGQKAKNFIDRYFNILAIILFALIILGFIILSMIL
jgi:membrane protein YqaA with SNARE-associated domain